MRNSTIRNLWPILTGLIGTAAACHDPAGLSAAAGTVPEAIIVTIPDTGNGALWIIDPETGDVLRRPTVSGAVTAAALSSDRRMLFANVVTHREATVSFKLAAVDLASGQTAWTVPMWNETAPVVAEDSIGLVSADYLAATSDGHTLFVGPAKKNSVYGLAAMSLASRQPVAYGGPWNIVSGGVIPLPPTATYPHGQIALIAARSSGGSRHGEQLYLLDQSTLAVTDSVASSALGGAAGEDIWQAALASDGRTLYLAGSSRIARFDLTTHRVTAAENRPSRGAMTLMPGDSTIVFGDVGAWPDHAGSGLMFVMNRDLRLVDSIDVSTALGGHPHSPTATVTGAAAASRDGRTLYVSAGAEQTGPLYPAQPARVLVVDISQRRLLRTIPLRGYGRGLVFIGITN